MAEGLVLKARIMLEFGRREDALAIFEQARPLIDADRSSLRAAEVELAVGGMLTELEHPDAGRVLERAHERFEALDLDHVALADLELYRAIVALAGRDPAIARSQLQRAVALYERAYGDGMVLSRALRNLAIANQDLGELQAAIQAASRAVELTRIHGVATEAHSTNLLLLASLLNRDHNFALALQRLRELSPAQLKRPDLAAWVRVETARSLIGQGTQLELARTYLLQAKLMFESLGVIDKAREVEQLLLTPRLKSAVGERAAQTPNR